MDLPPGETRRSVLPLAPGAPGQEGPIFTYSRNTTDACVRTDFRLHAYSISIECIARLAGGLDLRGRGLLPHVLAGGPPRATFRALDVPETYVSQETDHMANTDSALRALSALNISHFRQYGLLVIFPKPPPSLPEPPRACRRCSSLLHLCLLAHRANRRARWVLWRPQQHSAAERPCRRRMH